MADNWRDGLPSEISYKRKFAFFPTKLNDGEKIWLKPFYRKFVSYHTRHYGTSISVYEDDEYVHTDVVEDVSEETYVVRKLAESL